MTPQTDRRIDGVAEPLLWNLRRLVDEFGVEGVRSVLDRLAGDEPDYIDPGPDPQPVDPEWLRSVTEGTPDAP